MKKPTKTEKLEATMKEIVELYEKHPELFEHLIEPLPSFVQAHLKYADETYVAQPEDVFVVKEKEIPMQHLALYATRDLKMIPAQPSSQWLYKHMATGEMYLLDVEYSADEDLERLEIIDIVTSKVNSSDDDLLLNAYKIYHSSFKAAQRKFKLRNFLTQP